MSDQGTLRQLFGLLAGLVLPGGADVAPARYGQEPLPCLGEVDPDLDRVELELARWAVEADLPLLGICRGLQVLNVALGGTLYQDIATQRVGALAHRGAGRPRNELLHPVRLERGSRLAELLGATEFAVNSLHHQAIDQLAGAARAVGWAPDGVIEAIELPDRRFAVAVQFHPEELWPEHEPSRRLFAAFVAACAGA